MMTLIAGRYQGVLTDGRLLCVLPDVIEMNKGVFPHEELYDPNEWLSSIDGENCWIEPASTMQLTGLFRQPCRCCHLVHTLERDGQNLPLCQGCALVEQAWDALQAVPAYVERTSL